MRPLRFLDNKQKYRNTMIVFSRSAPFQRSHRYGLRDFIVIADYEIIKPKHNPWVAVFENSIVPIRQTICMALARIVTSTILKLMETNGNADRKMERLSCNYRNVGHAQVWPTHIPIISLNNSKCNPSLLSLTAGLGGSRSHQNVSR